MQHPKSRREKAVEFVQQVERDLAAAFAESERERSRSVAARVEVAWARRAEGATGARGRAGGDAPAAVTGVIGGDRGTIEDVLAEIAKVDAASACCGAAVERGVVLLVGGRTGTYPACSACGAAVKFESSRGEEENVGARVCVSGTSSPPASSVMPTGQSATAPGEDDSNLPPPTSPRDPVGQWLSFPDLDVMAAAVELGCLPYLRERLRRLQSDPSRVPLELRAVLIDENARLCEREVRRA